MIREPASTRRRLVKVTIGISDLACGDSISVERRLAALSGVEMAYVNPLTEMAYVLFDPYVCRVDEISGAIQDLGFRPGELWVRSRSR